MLNLTFSSANCVERLAARGSANFSQKEEIWHLKRKSLNINFLFIELLYTINITFVIMLIFGGKNGTLRGILTIWNRGVDYAGDAGDVFNSSPVLFHWIVVFSTCWGFNGAMFINAEWFTFQKDKIVYILYISMAISHSGCHVTTRASSHVRSRAVSNFHRGRDEFKVAKNSSLLFYDKVKQRKLACGIWIVLHNVEWLCILLLLNN